MQAILENLGTVIVCLILAVIVTLVILVMLRDKKNGISSCGNSCGACPMRGSCHAQRKQDEVEDA